MPKHRFPQQDEPGFSVGFPLGVIAVLMLAMTAYLVALNTQIPPPQPAVYFPTEQ